MLCLLRLKKALNELRSSDMMEVYSGTERRGVDVSCSS